MKPWPVEADLLRPLPDLSDGILEDGELDPRIVGLDYDALVADRCSGKGFTPCSVDCICMSGRTTYFIEFKTEGGGVRGSEIESQYGCKAVESLMHFDRFVKRTPTERRVLLIVTADPRTAYMTAVETRSAEKGIPDSLRRYDGKLDREGSALFYDGIRMVSAREFVSFANNHLTGSTREGMLKRILSDRTALRRKTVAP